MSELYINGVPYEIFQREIERQKEQGEEDIKIPEPSVVVPQQKAVIKYK